MQGALFFQMERLQLWAFFSLFTVAIAQSNSSYLVLAPQTIRLGLPVSLTVTILTNSKVQVSAEITKGNQTLTSNFTDIDGGSTKLLILPPVQDTEPTFKSYYKLKVKGHVGGVQLFSESWYLNSDPKIFSTFIQTDKVQYLPDQEVKIRVVSIYPNGRPFVSPVDIFLRDPRGNLLRQWLDVDSVLGVVNQTFQLSGHPPLGDWTITATIKDTDTKKSFTVARYVLPKFEVLINVPEVFHYKDVLQGSVTAKYTFGKPVQGLMNISFIPSYPNINGGYTEERVINGMEDFTFHFLNNSMAENNAKTSILVVLEESITVVVRVTEVLTGLTYNNSAKVTVANKRYKVSFQDYPETLRPLNFTAILKISTFDGRPLSAEDQQKMVKVSVKQYSHSQYWMIGLRPPMIENPFTSSEMYYGSGDIPTEEMVFPVPEDGLIPLNIEVFQETEVFMISANFEDGQESLQLHNRYNSPSDSYLQIQRPSTPPEVNADLNLIIESNFPKEKIHYMVKSRNQALLAGTVSGDLTLVPEPSWAPLASIIVYCINSRGEVINDAITLPIKLNLENQVSLKWSSEMKRPGENVNLAVTVTEPSSLVGILVVDRATQLAGSNNDLTKERVMKELEGFGGAYENSNVFATGNPITLFKKFDLIVLTDAELPSFLPVILPSIPNPEFSDTSPSEEAEPHERQYFPETWIWLTTDTGASNSVNLPFEAPDSITSWVATAFAMSGTLGLGIVDEPAVLTVFQDFFLSLNLPASVVRGEELLLEIILFNYLPQALQISVVITPVDESFEFVFPDLEGQDIQSVHQVFVESESGKSLLVPIRPLKLGEMSISVTATSAVASDRILRTVLVKAEGLEQFFSKTVLLEVSSPDTSLSSVINFSFPPDVVEGSKRAEVKVAGNVLGPSISGLESLIRMPYGCGEQNMINFAPNIYALQYLKATNQDNIKIAVRAESFVLSGYERELSYQRQDGSFSAFGEGDKSGSTWLSAFVLRCFMQAQPFIAIDERVLRDVTVWIEGQQGSDGRFEEPGRVFSTKLQGGLDGPVSLTAYVVIALLENTDHGGNFSRQVTSALSYLESRLALNVSSNYSLALLAYALALAERPGKDTALSQLLGRATITDGVPSWSSRPGSASIEIPSYVLLTQLKLGRVNEGVVLMKWLSQQRNDRGGYRSTQDTIIALQALSSVAMLGGSGETNLIIRMLDDNLVEVASFIINQDNELLHQSQQIEPTDQLNLQVTAEGQGLALVQLNTFYNVRNDGLTPRGRNTDEQDAFDLNINLIQQDEKMFQLNICSSLLEGLGINMTGMAVIEVVLLSGFRLSQDLIPTNDVVRNVEEEPGKLNLYLDSVSITEEVCVTVLQVMETKVAKVQEGNVVIYDYYEPERKTMRFYKSDLLSNLSTCSLCGDDCAQCQADGEVETTETDGEVETTETDGEVETTETDSQAETAAARQNGLNTLLLFILLLFLFILFDIELRFDRDLVEPRV